MSVTSFSLSISSRGRDCMIGGSGILDVDGMSSLRQAIEERCNNDDVAVMLDLVAVTEVDPATVAGLAEVAGFCRDKGISLTLTAGSDFLRVLNDAGYNEELLPLS